jgi:hypothetical protein
MSDKVQCATHGEEEATFVCRHIAESLDTGKAVGFFWPRDTDMARPDAWCAECEQVCLSEGGEWTDTALKFVQVTVLCGGCYDRAKAICLRARAQ